MPVLTIGYRHAAARLGLEQAIALFTPRRPVAPTAPDGTALAAGAPVALRDGRARRRTNSAAAAQARIGAAEQPGGPPAPGPARAAAPASPKAAIPATP